MLIVFGGLPDTGKTTLAQALSRGQRMSYVLVDAIEAGLITAGLAGRSRSRVPALARR